MSRVPLMDLITVCVMESRSSLEASLDLSASWHDSMTNDNSMTNN